MRIMDVKLLLWKVWSHYKMWDIMYYMYMSSGNVEIAAKHHFRANIILEVFCPRKPWEVFKGFWGQKTSQGLESLQTKPRLSPPLWSFPVSSSRVSNSLPHLLSTVHPATLLLTCYAVLEWLLLYSQHQPGIRYLTAKPLGHPARYHVHFTDSRLQLREIM